MIKVGVMRKNREKHRQRIEDGICTKCGKNKPREDRMTCAVCAGKIRNENLKRRAKNEIVRCKTKEEK